MKYYLRTALALSAIFVPAFGASTYTTDALAFWLHVSHGSKCFLPALDDLGGFLMMPGVVAFGIAIGFAALTYDHTTE